MSQEGVLSGVDLTDERYTVEQAYVRNKYEVYDEAGELVLRAKQKLFKMKEEFPFVDADDRPVFTVKASGIIDIAGDYSIVDESTGETVAVLDTNFTLLKHVWQVRDPEGVELARIESRSAAIEFLRGLTVLSAIIPHKYDITGPDGRQLGSIEGQLSIRDRYDITIRETGDAPREALVAAAIAIDALEGN
jgi:uncharacterized protein YxjI